MAGRGAAYRGGGAGAAGMNAPYAIAAPTFGAGALGAADSDDPYDCTGARSTSCDSDVTYGLTVGVDAGRNEPYAVAGVGPAGTCAADGPPTLGVAAAYAAVSIIDPISA